VISTLDSPGAQERGREHLPHSIYAVAKAPDSAAGHDEVTTIQGRHDGHRLIAIAPSSAPASQASQG